MSVRSPINTHTSTFSLNPEAVEFIPLTFTRIPIPPIDPNPISLLTATRPLYPTLSPSPSPSTHNNLPPKPQGPTLLNIHQTDKCPHSRGTYIPLDNLKWTKGCNRALLPLVPNEYQRDRLAEIIVQVEGIIERWRAEIRDSERSYGIDIGGGSGRWEFADAWDLFDYMEECKRRRGEGEGVLDEVEEMLLREGVDVGLEPRRGRASVPGVVDVTQERISTAGDGGRVGSGNQRVGSVQGRGAPSNGGRSITDLRREPVVGGVRMTRTTASRDRPREVRPITGNAPTVNRDPPATIADTGYAGHDVPSPGERQVLGGVRMTRTMASRGRPREVRPRDDINTTINHPPPAVTAPTDRFIPSPINAIPHLQSGGAQSEDGEENRNQEEESGESSENDNQEEESGEERETTTVDHVGVTRIDSQATIVTRTIDLPFLKPYRPTPFIWDLVSRTIYPTGHSIYPFLRNGNPILRKIRPPTPPEPATPPTPTPTVVLVDSAPLQYVPPFARFLQDRRPNLCAKATTAVCTH